MRHPIPYMTKTKTGWNYNPLWRRECRAPKVLTMPKPRVEDSARTVARLGKLKGDKRAKDHVGWRAGDFYLAATDGHRALLLPFPVPDTLKERKELPPDMSELPYSFVELPDCFYTVLQRAIAIHSDAPWAVSLDIGERFIVKAKADDHDTFQEEIATFMLVTKGATIGFNAKYLMDALGVWPLYLHFTDAEHMVVLRPEDDSWRYLLMPLKL